LILKPKNKILFTALYKFCIELYSYFLRVFYGKIKVFSKLWDEKAQKVKKQHHLALEINHRLTQLKADIEKSVLTLIARNPDYMADDVKDLVEQLVNGKINHSQQITFWSAFDMYISEKRKLCKEGTVKKIVTTYNLLFEFQKLHYTLTFEKINNDFKVDLLSYMTDEKKYLNNNISKHFSIIKTFMRWASEKEYHANTKFEQIKYQSDVVDVLALTEEELDKIINVNLSFSSSLDKTRDIFVFGCLTGQRYSDLKNLKLGDLNLESVNPTWALYQVKGNKRKKITVPLLPKAVEILKKQCDFSNPIECYAFKIQCNQKMNQNIKVVAELAKVNTPVNKNRY
jgi:integrase